MIFFRRLICGLTIFVFPAFVPGQTNQAVLTVRGTVEQPLALSLADLQTMPRIKLAALEKDGHEAAFEGVALYEVVNRTKPRLTEKCCGNAVNTLVVVKAADNYQAVFLLSELDPKFGHRQILLADQRDGKPLAATQGPLQIIVPGEKMHARWVRQVNLIEISPLGDLGQAHTNAVAH